MRISDIPKRLIANIAIIVSILFAPWWITAPLMLLSCVFIPRFYEMVLYGILIDSIYSTSWGIYGFTYVWSLGTAIMLLIVSIIRPWLSWE